MMMTAGFYKGRTVMHQCSGKLLQSQCQLIDNFVQIEMLVQANLRFSIYLKMEPSKHHLLQAN